MTTAYSDLLARLEEGVTTLTTSAGWRRYLDFQSRFHRYSFGNVLLIGTQCPEATQVAGFATWRRLDRPVRKGEKAIWILAPLTVRDDDGGHRAVRGFRRVAVFDISQTEGAAPPAVCTRLAGGDPADLYGQLLDGARRLGFSVVDQAFSDGRNGDCLPAERHIRIEAANPPAQRVKTLAHELAHGLLHEHAGDRTRAELEAESTAYVVCGALGLDAGAYSVGYVASWAGDGQRAITVIKESCQSIQRAAVQILDAADRTGRADRAVA
ncbi:MAG: ArdC-like ssDNA-binding domain-containing protein [Acidimicrobiales bacterium]